MIIISREKTTNALVLVKDGTIIAYPANMNQAREWRNQYKKWSQA